MRHTRVWVIAIFVLATFGVVVAQSGPDKDATWSAFLAWFKTADLEGNPLAPYAAKLQRDG
jgi:hypothetical protein